MATFLMFGKYSAQAIEQISAERTASAVELVKKFGGEVQSMYATLGVVAAPEGVAALEKSGHPLRLFVAAVDEGLNDVAYIVPGLGDAGDRQFGPR